jgi:hypothetical protein
VEIVLTEDDLAAIIAESSRNARAPAPKDLPWEGEDRPAPGAGTPGLAFAPPEDASGAYSPIADAVWRQGVARPGALDEAIRRILDATTLKPRRPTFSEEE